MVALDYAIFSRKRVLPADIFALSYDVFISSYNSSDRVQTVFSRAAAAKKLWVIHPEYGYTAGELPTDAVHILLNEEPIQFWTRLIHENAILPGQSIAIDITGMMRPHVLVLPFILRSLGHAVSTFLYSDPTTYTAGGATDFTKGPVEEVRVIPGLGGSHVSGVDTKDVLVIGAGYDHELVKAAAESKRFAAHYLVVGLPALQPHMYQESIRRVANVSDSIRQYGQRSLLFAPASDPFVTAQVLSDHVAMLRNADRLHNLYLCPVGPKTQVLGFALFYMYEEVGQSASIIFPYTSGYERETSKGITATHVFELELELS